MIKTITLILVIYFVSTAAAFSQSISGKILDASSSEPLVGAVIKIEGTKLGANSDLDGTYRIVDLNPGQYDVVVSYIGYETKTIKGVVVSAKKDTKLDVALNIEGIVTEEIEIEATTSLANEESLLIEQKNSSKIQDGISEQQIKRAPDAAASEVLKRVIGVNIVDNKFVYVRGISERYNNTTLNGVLVPSVESDKKSFSFDLFPSNLIENIIVSKSFTPDQYGNYSGGLVQLATKEFPDQFTFNFATTGAIVNGVSTKGGFYDYNASEKKFLFFNTGRDDGGRSIPSNFPTEPFRLPNDYGKTLNNNWAQINSKAPVNGGFQMSLGNNFNLWNNPLGLSFGYTYNNGFDNEEIKRVVYQGNDTASIVDLNGRSSVYKVLMGGLLNLNYKIGDNNKFGIKNTFTQGAEDETQYYEGVDKLSDNYEKQFYRYAFTEKRLLATQLNGSHYFNNLANLYVNWRLAYSETRRNEPDWKTAYYQRQLGTEDPYAMPLTIFPNSNVGQRFYSNLFDINRGFNLDFENNFVRINKKSSQSKIKYGLFANGTDRNFQARLFAPANAGGFAISYYGIDSIFSPNNFDPTLLYMVETTDRADQYSAVENNYAGYVMFDLPLGKLRGIVGLRYEYDEQKLLGFKRSTLVPDSIRVNSRTNDYLPSLNLTYAVDDNMNIRASASQTVNRPELRELAPFAYIDFLTTGLNTGNPNLQSTLIQNYDLRWELFPQAGEIVSLSLFYKHFNQPIERIVYPTTTNPNIPSYTYDNAKNGAVNYGFEVDMRKNLGFISEMLNDFALNVNYTMVNSKVDLEGLQTLETEKERRMQGQSPFTLNAGLFYDNYDIGLSANLLYNRDGDKISDVGTIGFSNIIETGMSRLDFSASKTFLEKFEAKIAIKNILNEEHIFTQKFTFEGVTTDRIVRQIKSAGPNYGFTLSYKF